MVIGQCNECGKSDVVNPIIVEIPLLNPTDNKWDGVTITTETWCDNCVKSYRRLALRIDE
jgi:hypothetical protein